jgi:anti-sigma regulatory factor (Ser/Thr protein kinase)
VAVAFPGTTCPYDLLVSLPTPLARAPLHGLALYHGGEGLSAITDAMPFMYTTNLSEVRALAESEARVSGMPEDRIIDFVIAVAEVTANTVRHARSPGSMEIWLAGGELVCEIRDAGVITDPAAGRRPPPDEASGGHGLWLVHQICDRVDLHSDESGTVIRLYMTLR